MHAVSELGVVGGVMLGNQQWGTLGFPNLRGLSELPRGAYELSVVITVFWVTQWKCRFGEAGDRKDVGRAQKDRVTGPPKMWLPAPKQCLERLVRRRGLRWSPGVLCEFPVIQSVTQTQVPRIMTGTERLWKCGACLL